MDKLKAAEEAAAPKWQRWGSVLLQVVGLISLYPYISAMEKGRRSATTGPTHGVCVAAAVGLAVFVLGRIVMVCSTLTTRRRGRSEIQRLLCEVNPEHHHRRGADFQLVHLHEVRRDCLVIRALQPGLAPIASRPRVLRDDYPRLFRFRGAKKVLSCLFGLLFICLFLYLYVLRR